MKTKRQPARERLEDLLEVYRATAKDLRVLLALGDVALQYGRGRRAAEHLLEMIGLLAPDLTVLRDAALRATRADAARA